MKKIVFNLESGESIEESVVGYSRLDQGDALIFGGSKIVFVGKIRSVTVGKEEIPVSGLRLTDLPFGIEDEEEDEDESINVDDASEYKETEVHTTPAAPKGKQAQLKADAVVSASLVEAVIDLG